MSTKTITDLADVREGDTVTYAYKGHEVTGVVWSDRGGLSVGGADVEWFNGSNDYKFVSATREIPELPTEVGSVIVDIESVNGPFDWAVRDLGSDRNWRAWSDARGDHLWINSAAITSWKPGKVVEA